MPNSIGVEQAVLGALLLSREKYPEVDALISSVDFESDVHKEIYECIIIYQCMKSHECNMTGFLDNKVKNGLISTASLFMRNGVRYW